jgi:uncharacterized membrane protein
VNDAGREREAAAAPRPLGLSERQAAVLAWSGAWVTGLLCLWLEPGPPFVRHHALHAAALLGLLMLLALGLWAACLLSAFFSPTLFRLLAWATTITWGIFVVGWLAGLVSALRQRRLFVPWLTPRLERAGLRQG